MPRTCSGGSWDSLKIRTRLADRVQRMHGTHAERIRPSLRQVVFWLDRDTQRSRSLRRCAMLRMLHFLIITIIKNMNSKTHPVDDGFLARETERLELLKATYSLRADGSIFRDRGDGWNRVVLLATVTPEAYWLKIKAKDATLSREFKAYRTAVIDAIPLCDRPEYFTLVDLLGDDVDGIWSHMDEIGKRVEIETLVELRDLDNARRAAFIG